MPRTRCRTWVNDLRKTRLFRCKAEIRSMTFRALFFPSPAGCI